MWKKQFLLLFMAIIYLGSTAHAALSKTEVDGHMNTLYTQFKFTRYNKISMTAFKAGVTGFYNLKEEGKLSKDILTICDFTLSSKRKRMWVLDMKNKKVLMHTYVAHGQGSGEEYARKFSNVPNSHASSQGFYVTGTPYTGRNGESMKLHGMDGKFNSNAYSRAVVVHGAAYADPSFIKAAGRLGRSYGCPAVPRTHIHRLIQITKNKSALFVYSPLNNYMSISHWIKNPINKLPGITPNKPEGSTTIKEEIKKSTKTSAQIIAEKNAGRTDGKTMVGYYKLTPEQVAAYMKAKENSTNKNITSTTDSSNTN